MRARSGFRGCALERESAPRERGGEKKILGGREGKEGRTTTEGMEFWCLLSQLEASMPAGM